MLGVSRDLRGAADMHESFDNNDQQASKGNGCKTIYPALQNSSSKSGGWWEFGSLHRSAPSAVCAIRICPCLHATARIWFGNRARIPRGFLTRKGWLEIYQDCMDAQVLNILRPEVRKPNEAALEFTAPDVHQAAPMKANDSWLLLWDT